MGAFRGWDNRVDDSISRACAPLEKLRDVRRCQAAARSDDDCRWPQRARLYRQGAPGVLNGAIGAYAEYCPAAADVVAGHIYWTNMGKPTADDGSIERADFDGQNRQTIVPQGGTFTPKQLQLEKTSGKLYWCDREGMRLMRANVDGSTSRPS